MIVGCDRKNTHLESWLVILIPKVSGSVETLVHLMAKESEGLE